MCGRSDTRYSPVRRSPSYLASQIHAAPRLACVKPVASVHPEPGSNSSSYFILFFSFFLHAAGAQAPDRIPGYPRAATKKQTAAQMDTASLSSSYGIISKIFTNRFVPESECKSTDFYNNCQILNTLFSKEKESRAEWTGVIYYKTGNYMKRKKSPDISQKEGAIQTG